MKEGSLCLEKAETLHGAGVVVHLLIPSTYRDDAKRHPVRYDFALQLECFPDTIYTG
jgi:hypothetical protein